MKQFVLQRLAPSAILIVMLTCFSLSSFAGNKLEDGLSAFSKGQYATAMRRLRPFADQGYAIAQTDVGYMYESGNGVPQDYNEAAKWYRKAAEQGDGDGQWMLGYFYEFGNGVPQDYNEAVKWYRKAAEQGNAGGQLDLGLMYQYGNGVPQDFVQAYMWINLAASHYSAFTERRDALAKSMTTEQIAEGQRLSRNWKPEQSK